MAQLVLPFETRPALGREDFIVAPANCDAVAMIDRWPDWPAQAIALYGPAGSGKSHLASAWAARADARIAGAPSLDASVLDGRAVVVEDLDASAPDAVRDALVFALIERGTPLLLTGREPPQHWRATLPDLASRYRALLAFALWEPDEAMLTALARKLFADRQLAVPDVVVEQMLRALERSPGAVRDFVRRADQRALAEKKSVSPKLIRDLLVQGACSTEARKK
jgi:chromosomal replication initiation ATPase DnaA